MSAQAAPARAGGGASRRLALAILCAGQLMVILDGTIVNVALPSIQESLGFSPSGLGWVVNAYLIPFGGLLLLSGRSATSSAAHASSPPAWWCSPWPRCSAVWHGTRPYCSHPASSRARAAP